MDISIKIQFLELWSKYFPGVEFPLFFYYSDEPNGAEMAKVATGWRCFIGDLSQVRRGKSMYYSKETLGCGKRFLGLDSTLRPNFNQFLSCGIPGELEGERYKQTPELVVAWKESLPFVPADKKYIIFKRWDYMEEIDEPLVVVFFATPDVLSGLFTWAGFDQADAESVAAPFGAGCASIVQYPLLEAQKERPRAILGMFDISARPRVKSNELSFAIPWAKFLRMINNAEETFFTTKSWNIVRNRIIRNGQEETDSNK